MNKLKKLCVNYKKKKKKKDFRLDLLQKIHVEKSKTIFFTILDMLCIFL